MFIFYIQYPKFSIVPFRDNRLFKRNNAFLKLSHTHPALLHLLNQNPPKNRYTRKQPTHFSITPLRPKLKNKIQNSRIAQFGMSKKMTS